MHIDWETYSSESSIRRHAEARGYARGEIDWKSQKSQRFRCPACNKTYPRMEVLLQHLRDSKRHSADPLAQQASRVLRDWMSAKDKQQPCCGTCCLGFDSHTELLLHLKHTAVHKGTPEAEQAASLLLPKDEARFLRRNLQGNAAASAAPLQSPKGSLAAQPSTESGAGQTATTPTKENVVWQVLSAEKLNAAQDDVAKQAPTAAATTGEARQGAETQAEQDVGVAKERNVADCAMEVSDVDAVTAQQSSQSARQGEGMTFADMKHAYHGKRDAAAILVQQDETVGTAAFVSPPPDGAFSNGPLHQPKFVQSLRRRTILKKSKHSCIGQQPPSKECSTETSGYSKMHMGIIEAHYNGCKARLPRAKKPRR